MIYDDQPQMVEAVTYHAKLLGYTQGPTFSRAAVQAAFGVIDREALIEETARNYASAWGPERLNVTYEAMVERVLVAAGVITAEDEQ